MIDLLVIGGGPAGVAGAVHAHRAGLETLLVERERVGGLIWNANLVENHPGLPRPMDGPAVAKLLQGHLDRNDVPRCYTEITALRREGSLFHADTGAGCIAARAVLLATGSRPRPLPLEGAEAAQRSGRLYYEVSRLPQLSGSSSVLIVGGGDAAFDYALNCARQGAQVTILIRGAKPTSLPLLVERVAAVPAIEVHTGARLLRVFQDNSGRVGLAGRREAEADKLRLTGDLILAAVGRDPDNLLARGLDPLLPDCYDDGPPGGGPALYLAGDAAHGRFRQMSIAAGEGVLAAMHAAARLTGGRG
jgi:thioredoxin reductase